MADAVPEAFVRRDERNAVLVGGALVRATAARVFAELARALPGAGHLDLSRVTEVDSAGVALLSSLLADRALELQVVPPPPGVGLDALRAAYRLDERLAFA